MRKDLKELALAYTLTTHFLFFMPFCMLASFALGFLPGLKNCMSTALDGLT